jgi:hypothetical protein
MRLAPSVNIVNSTLSENSATTDPVGGSYIFTVLLNASRKGMDGDGRHYVITVSASDNAG